MDRRDFMKICTATASAAALSSCGMGQNREESSADGGLSYRTDPKTGRKTSLLGFGCMRWPEIRDERSTGETVPDQEVANRLVDRAIEAGITYFDTAPVYSGGLSETVTGNALARHPREKWTIATKLSNFRPESRSKEASVRMYHESHEKLQTDTIDYYLLHAAGDRLEVDDFQERFVDNGMLDFLMDEREKGHIVELGFSFHGGRESFDRVLQLHEKYHWDFAQIQMNYVDWNHAGRMRPGICDASYLYSALCSKNIPAIIMEPLLGGQLADIPQGHTERLAQMDPQGTAASWAFRFCGSFPGVLTVLSGMKYMEHLEENIKTFSPLRPLSDKETQTIEHIGEILATYPTIPCTGCAYCMPCPYGIDIPSLLKHYNRCISETYIVTDTRDEDYARFRRFFLSSYNRAVDMSRQADKCIACNQCSPQCPQQIDIPAKLRKLDILAEKLRRGDAF